MRINRMNWIAAAAMLLLAPVALAQTTVTLLASSPKGLGASQVRVGDVALVVGTDAEKLREIVVAESAGELPRAAAAGPDSAWAKVDIALVRGAMNKEGVNWGKVTLRGSACMVRVDEAAPQPEKKAPQKKLREPGVVDVASGQTVRTVIAATLADLCGVAPADLRLSFDPKDEELLASNPAAANKRLDVQPAAAASSSRIPVRVFVYNGERMEIGRTVTVDAEVSRFVAVAEQQIDRGQTVTADMVRTERQWVAPNAKVLAPEQVVGQEAAGRIEAGETISKDDVAAAIACKRGDVVYVHCLSGAVRIQAKARAMATARDGELVQLKLEGADKKEKPFLARMSGRGRAVMVVGDDQQEQVNP